MAAGPSAPKYGARKGWKPVTQADYGGGGAYPEVSSHDPPTPEPDLIDAQVHKAQYPLDMGKKSKGAGTTLALQVDADGTVRYDAIAQHGRALGSKVQSSFKG